LNLNEEEKFALKEEMDMNSGNFFRKLIESSPDALIITDLERRIIFVSQRTLFLFSCEKQEELIGRNILDFVKEEDRPRTVEDFKKALQGELVLNSEYTFLKKNRTTFKGEVAIALTTESGGKPMALNMVLRDISRLKEKEEEIKRLLEEKDALLREGHHRMKNNMQVILSLLGLQAGKTKNEKIREVFRAIQRRVKSMVLIHEKLSHSKDMSKIDFSDYLRRLAAYLFSAYGKEKSRVKMELAVNEFSLDIDRAILCGLIVNELVSNSLKYAFPNGKGGAISIQMSEELDGRWRLVVRDNGVGLGRDFDVANEETLGMQLVMALVKQLNGHLEVRREEGTEFIITF